MLRVDQLAARLQQHVLAGIEVERLAIQAIIHRRGFHHHVVLDVLCGSPIVQCSAQLRLEVSRGNHHVASLNRHETIVRLQQLRVCGHGFVNGVRIAVSLVQFILVGPFPVAVVVPIRVVGVSLPHQVLRHHLQVEAYRAVTDRLVRPSRFGRVLLVINAQLVGISFAWREVFEEIEVDIRLVRTRLVQLGFQVDHASHFAHQHIALRVGGVHLASGVVRSGKVHRRVGRVAGGGSLQLEGNQLGGR